MNLEVFTIGGGDTAEFYLTATPSGDESTRDQGKELFCTIQDVLHQTNAQILDERLFATANAMEALIGAREDAYGGRHDGVPPTCLVVPEGLGHHIKGVQVHAVRSKETVDVLAIDGAKCGRVLRQGNCVFVAVSGLTAPEWGGPAAQTHAVLEKAETLLQQQGGDMRSIVRTWFWLNDVLSWYDNFNCVRTDFFMKHGLINADPTRAHLPASTGIGMKPRGEAQCALGLVAVVEPRDAVEFLLAGGNQGSAYDYGSAFSRAARAPTPGGETLFVSGTAAVDEQGRTTDRNDAMAQIEATITNVRAIISNASCSEKDVVQAVAYCKTEEEERLFREMRDRPDWPFITVIGEVCRRNLLFEVEVTAAPGARKISDVL